MAPWLGEGLHQEGVLGLGCTDPGRALPPGWTLCRKLTCERMATAGGRVPQSLAQPDSSPLQGEVLVAAFRQKPAGLSASIPDLNVTEPRACVPPAPPASLVWRRLGREVPGARGRHRPSGGMALRAPLTLRSSWPSSLVYRSVSCLYRLHLHGIRTCRYITVHTPGNMKSSIK